MVDLMHYFSPFLSKAAKPSGQLNFIDISCLATFEALKNIDQSSQCQIWQYVIVFFKQKCVPSYNVILTKVSLLTF